MNPSPSAKINRRGLMLVLSSPSGAGKTTLSRRLLEMDDNLSLSVSVTTRPKRSGEQDGVDYCFVEPDEFKRMVKRREFLEYARVFGRYYGTPAAAVERKLEAGRDVLLDIDWQGARTLRKKSRKDLVTVFVLPPSLPELARRLDARAQDSAVIVAKRMARASAEIGHWREFDYVVINDDLEDCLKSLAAIVCAERLKRGRQTGLVDFVKRLL
jgi:guanylate kinase